MANKPFSRKTKSMSQIQWISEAGSRENIEIFLHGDTLCEWSIARPIGRARIETWNMPNMDGLTMASPGQLAGRGLKPSLMPYPNKPKGHRPANWPGAD